MSAVDWVCKKFSLESASGQLSAITICSQQASLTHAQTLPLAVIINMYSGNLARILVWRLHFLFLWNNDARKSHAAQQTLKVRNVLSEVFVGPIDLFG